MKHNENYYKSIDPECCEKTPEPCVPPRQTCGTEAKEDFEKYLEEEACKPEYFEPFNPCDFDWNDIYMFQYRSKYARYKDDK